MSVGLPTRISNRSCLRGAARVALWPFFDPAADSLVFPPPVVKPQIGTPVSSAAMWHWGRSIDDLVGRLIHLAFACFDPLSAPRPIPRIVPDPQGLAPAPTPLTFGSGASG
jgi:hypothetical protein